MALENVELVSDCFANVVVADGSSDGDKFWSCTYRKGGVILECLRSIYDTRFTADIWQKGIIMLQHCEKFAKKFIKLFPCWLQKLHY